MNLRSSDRLRVLLMGAVAAGVFGPPPSANAGGPVPVLANSKKPFGVVTKPAVATAPPRLLPVSDAESKMIRPVAQTESVPAATANKKSEKSEVMRQLELLYQQDGREMPDLNTDIKPVPNSGGPGGTSGTGGAASVTPPATPRTANAPAAAPNGLRTQQSPAGQKQNKIASTAPLNAPSATTSKEASTASAASATKSKYPVLSFFKKLVPGYKESKSTKAPTEYRPDVAPVPPGGIAAKPPATLRQENPGRVGTTAAGGTTLPLLDGQPRTPFAVTADGNSNPLPQPLVNLNNLPPSPNGDLGLPAAQAELLPPLLTEPGSTNIADFPNVAASDGEKQAGDAASPFSEMSEAEADKSLELNPFTGLTLDEEAGSANVPSGIPAAAPGTAAPSPSETLTVDDPFADELKKMGVVPPVTEPAVETPNAVDTPNIVPPKSDSPTFDGIEDQATRDKMKKIHERGTMKGLKGFCPVTLRDERELVDAKPDFHSTFRGQKFHFADADAKLKFDEEPVRYAPAAYGADVVALTRDKDVVEGSLDFAAWFKGRLYLFGSQNAHDTFVADPSLYATPVGIE